ncbi:Pc20g15750 [Penicillium rubens Wisconsin 54-1255]|uniref:Pc20g15750 protein n=3 Tax=Penicillium chrysogenum species complex TaxID=254878 RepID=B6HE64_PENRW|nr:Pc20g15750 [Penicillium rubens Wisconsin 54-1255]
MGNFGRSCSVFKRCSFELVCAALCFGLSGMSRGLDEGIISTTVAQRSFIDEFHIQGSELDSSQQANLLSNITSMVHIASIPGALIALFLCGRIGLLWSMRELCMFWMLGSIIVITSTGSLGQLYAGRFIMGLGIGQAGVVAPTYLAEIAPAHARGMLVSMFAMSEYIGIMIGYFSAWGASLHISNTSATQWIIPQSIQVIVAGLLILLSFFCEESPRYLSKIGDWGKAKEALGRIWGVSALHPEVILEIEGIHDELQADQNHTFRESCFRAIRELLAVKANQQRLLFLISGQVLAQWSGANSITTYAPELFALFGIKGQSQKLLVTAVFGAVKFIASFLCAVLLIDHLGRKRSLLAGIMVQQIAFMYIAVFLTVESFSTDENSNSLKGAAIGAVISMYFVGIGWAMGWNSIQYVINAEIFPLRVRSTGSSLLMCFHYANRYGISKAVPSMLLHDSLQPQGTFWFFSVVTLFGFLWTGCLLPETAGRSLEETNVLFSQ